MPELDQGDLVGRWSLTSWQTRLGDQVIRTLGTSPSGCCSTPRAGGWRCRRWPGRERIETQDPLVGSEQERAAAYSGSLAYCGRYAVRDGAVVHSIELSSFPNWVGDEQLRLLELRGDEFVLRTPPIETPGGRS